MKKILFFSLVVTSLISCQKEISVDSSSGTGGTAGGGGTTGNIIGTWRFVGATSETVATVEMTDGTDLLKTVTFTKYSTTDNKGTVTFTADKMIYKDFGYSINSTLKGYFYVNADLLDSLEAPLNFVLPNFNSESSYTRVGSDSITVTGSSISVPAGSGTSQVSGARYRFEGNKLVVYSNFNTVSIVDVGGDPAKQTAKGSFSMYLEK